MFDPPPKSKVTIVPNSSWFMKTWYSCKARKLTEFIVNSYLGCDIFANTATAWSYNPCACSWISALVIMAVCIKFSFV